MFPVMVLYVVSVVLSFIDLGVLLHKLSAFGAIVIVNVVVPVVDAHVVTNELSVSRISYVRAPQRFATLCVVAAESAT